MVVLLKNLSRAFREGKHPQDTTSYNKIKTTLLVEPKRHFLQVPEGIASRKELDLLNIRIVHIFHPKTVKP